MKLRSEKYSTGKFDVLTCGDYPRRVGHITGARDVWLPEVGCTQLSYQKTKKAAIDAIRIEVIK